MKIKDLKPGMIVYDAHKYNMGNTTLKTMGVWHVEIIEVDAEKETVVASWNGNTARKYFRPIWSKWRAKEPILIPTLMGGNRLATRDEIKAMKAKEA